MAGRVTHSESSPARYKTKPHADAACFLRLQIGMQIAPPVIGSQDGDVLQSSDQLAHLACSRSAAAIW